MKKITKISTLFIVAFTFSMCSNSAKQDNPTISATKSEACMKPTSAGDSAKFQSKQIEVKGEVEKSVNTYSRFIKGDECCYN